MRPRPSRRQAHGDAGVVCWTCLDFGHLKGLGPCPDCRPDTFVEYLLTRAAAEVEATQSEEGEAAQ